MGREVKRVPLDFDWPLNTVWEGYINPYYTHVHDCPVCQGSGESFVVRALQSAWFGWIGEAQRYLDRVPDSAQKASVVKFISGIQHARGWQFELAQPEIDALFENGRFHREFDNEKPTPEQVNTAYQVGFGHDAINRWICVKAKAETLGVVDVKCAACNGEGSFWDAPEFEKLCEQWERVDPPTGDGWQLWEDVSEGSPISPVFAERESFVAWLVDTGYSPGAAEKFIEIGWSPSLVLHAGGMVNGIDACEAIPD